MISAIATRIDQSFDLETRESQNYLVFQLPDGTELRADVDIEMVEHLLTLTPGGTMPARRSVKLAEVPEHAEVDEPLFTVKGYEDEPGEEEVDTRGVAPIQDAPVIYEWRLLPDSSLSRTMKAAFALVNAPERLNHEEIQSLINSISEQFEESHWQEVAKFEKGMPSEETELPAMVETPVTAGPTPATVPRTPQPQPPVNQPTWSDGSPIVSGSRPARTVPKDSMGYPVVAGGNDVDPGEIVAGGDVDEDGVGQL